MTARRRTAPPEFIADFRESIHQIQRADMAALAWKRRRETNMANAKENLHQAIAALRAPEGAAGATRKFAWIPTLVIERACIALADALSAATAVATDKANRLAMGLAKRRLSRAHRVTREEWPTFALQAMNELGNPASELLHSPLPDLRATVRELSQKPRRPNGAGSD